MDCPLRVGVVGINFKTADLPLREAIARSAEGLAGQAGLFFPHPIIVLSTCNRCEIYFSSPDLAEAHTDLLRFFRRELYCAQTNTWNLDRIESRGFKSKFLSECGMNEGFEHRLYSCFGIHCLTHLCRVASGLDSAVVAETEIQRQVKCAYLSASKSLLPAEMHFLFQKALRVGKEIRTAFPQIQGGETIFKVIWDLIQQAEVDLPKASILFVGNSQINRALMRFLERRKMREPHLCTRSPDGEAFSFGREILSSWEKYDLIFCASQAFDYLLKHKAECEGKPRMIFDLSVPRNVDPEVGKIAGVCLFNIEQLDSLSKEKGLRGLDLSNLEERVRNHALRLCDIYRKKQRLRSLGTCKAGS